MARIIDLSKELFISKVGMGDILILDSFNKYLETLPRDRNYPSTTVTKNQKFVTLYTIVKDCLGYLPNCTAEQIPLVAKKTVPRSSAPKFF